MDLCSLFFILRRRLGRIQKICKINHSICIMVLTWTKYVLTKNCKNVIHSCQRTHILNPGPELRMTATFSRMCVSEQYLRLADNIFFFLCKSPHWARASSFTRFLDHTQRRTTVCRTPLDQWSAHRRDLYLTTHTTLTNRQISMPPVVFEPTISADERPQTHALDRAATGTGPCRW